MTLFNWQALADPLASNKRDSLLPEQIDQAIEAEIKTIQSSITTIREIMLVQGLMVTDLYHDMKRETAFTNEETLIAPRIRMDARHGTPSFYWEKTIRHAYPLELKPSGHQSKTRSYQGFVRRKGSKIKERMQVYLLSKHVPILKKTLGVSMKHFESEPQWVRTAAALIEPQLIELRKKAKILSEISRDLHRFESTSKLNSANKNYDPNTD